MEKESLKGILEKRNKFQQELNEVLSHYLSGSELKEIKLLISTYYAQKLTKEVDKLAEEKGWNQQTYDRWLNENMRTPYQSP